MGFSPNTDIGIDGQEYSFSDALKIVDANVMKQLLNPGIYAKVLGPEFEKAASDIEPSEPDDYSDYDDRDYRDRDY